MNLFIKRIFDVCVAVILSVILAPIILITAIFILILDGVPVFYISERMRTPSQPFRLYKFRTMTTVSQSSGIGISGGHKTSRITKTGAFLRKTRLDELPQLLNVIKGDMSFVGPRPPLREVVEKHPDVYKEVLKNRPGITGLASIYFHRHEEFLLRECKTAEDADRVYSTRCVPRKAHLDRLYANNQSLCLDIKLMIKTVMK